MFSQGKAGHRYLALLLLVLVLMCLYWLLNGLLSQADEARDRFEAMQLQLTKYESLAASRNEAESLQQRLLAAVAEDKRYLAATTPSLASAELQKYLQRVIQSSGAKLISMQAADVESVAGFMPVVMRLHLTLNHQALSQLLYQLESRQPVGFIDELQIKRRNSSRRVAQSADSQLEVRFVYQVYMAVSDDI